MGALLLDTSIVSYMFKGDSRATLYYSHLRGQEPMIAMMTLAELFQWAERRNWGPERVRELNDHLGLYTLLPVDVDTCRRWAKIRSDRYAIGRPISPEDAWIAATAVRYDMALVTHNPDDFLFVLGLNVITEAPMGSPL